MFENKAALVKCKLLEGELADPEFTQDRNQLENNKTQYMQSRKLVKRDWRLHTLALVIINIAAWAVLFVAAELHDTVPAEELSSSVKWSFVGGQLVLLALMVASIRYCVTHPSHYLQDYYFDKATEDQVKAIYDIKDKQIVKDYLASLRQVSRDYITVGEVAGLTRTVEEDKNLHLKKVFNELGLKVY